MNDFLQNKIIFFRNLGIENWSTTFKKMHDFTILRNVYTFDEIWFVEHYPIFTQGQSYNNEKEKNLIHINNIPLIKTNRGGKITYHGPGQQIVYFLIDLKRRHLTIRQLINIMEKTIVTALEKLYIKAYTKKQSPGVYINKKKICSLGLRVKKNFTLHGLAINVNMDLTPFNYIYPCGDINIKMTQIKDFNKEIKLEDLKIILIKTLSEFFQVFMIKKGK
ncbi:MAG: lipoyl(octanoyl) transferase LipB [Buchnera aphidicola (Brevicoryne brassicae)]|uniref:Octanoyltransferase n=1 Tax=Buchnera aphidicola (Brevicoryne brassicae) TaxID=911343 RepID=A0AAJ5PUW5_9GAMM|nr:lipoyl(octanoyl) transferase LipB [Buchnera aphidicola]QCI19832.1 lipoyl(octanoyl) transferase LipB [Buchnera aphidicola (Brevicoryne brassicae)]WAI19209.1 MAG: lipoyl(octanoyl) transferase LipB [Buchnera aphidicola (Brevicoryne brassicae)]